MNLFRSSRVAPPGAPTAPGRFRLLFPIVQQLMFLFFGAGVLDGGRCLQVIGYAVLAYWVGFGLVMIQRSGRLTKVDSFFVQVGFLMLVPVSTLVTQVVWHWQGYY